MKSTFTTIAFALGVHAQYKLKDTFDASNWEQAFDFDKYVQAASDPTSKDPTHGSVNYVSLDKAKSSGLLKVGKTVTMSVDSSTANVALRPAIRVESKAQYTGGLFISDVKHMPTGCGTWPALWTYGPSWPNGGEIDILEGVHTETTNQMTLHVAPTCPTKAGGFSGQLVVPDCVSQPGCGIKGGAFGGALNDAGGTVIAMEWTDQFIQMFRWAPGQVPPDVTSGSPNPASWGEPISKFEPSCGIANNFKQHWLTINTSLCGDWAGQDSVWASSGCKTDQYPTCQDYVSKNAGAFKDAYWEINSIKVYEKTGAAQKMKRSAKMLRV